MTAATTRRAATEAKLAPYINIHNAKAWHHSTERYCFIIDLLDDAEVGNSWWRWLENSLAGLWDQHTGKWA